MWWSGGWGSGWTEEEVERKEGGNGGSSSREPVGEDGRGQGVVENAASTDGKRPRGEARISRSVWESGRMESTSG
jgi:hypothetical protein